MMPFLDVKTATPSYEEYLSALGRAMAVSQNLEGSAHHVMVVWEITKERHEELDPDELRAIALRLRDLPLGGASRRLGKAADFGARCAQLLDRGRIARNWLAHEAAMLVDDQGDLRDDFSTNLAKFTGQIRSLCEADSLLAEASYLIQEREPTSSEFLETYARAVEEWVLEPIQHWLGSG